MAHQTKHLVSVEITPIGSAMSKYQAVKQGK